jgi:WS/DGAT/MGAT family acyltransferase
MERFNGLDTALLAVDDEAAPMHIGSVAVFEAPAPTFDEVRAFVAAKVQSIPRCRQRVREQAGPFGRPMWIDDDSFGVDDHVRHASVAGDTPAALDDLVARVMKEPLDRRRALWALWFVDGLAGGRWALVAKAHHCMVDGIAGSDLLGAVLDHAADARQPTRQDWSAAPAPSARDVRRFDRQQRRRSARARLARFLAACAHPRRMYARLRDVLSGAKRLWYRAHRAGTSLTGPIGVHRRWARTRIRLDDVTTVRRAFGGTVNDVVVAVIARAFGDLLRGRGESAAGRSVTALVPVSMRDASDHATLGNLLADVHALLPVGIDDAVETLRAVHAHIEDLKASHEVDASGAVMRVGDLVPRAVADRVARAIVRHANVDTAVTNVPGPRAPLFCCGRRMLEGYPYAPIAGQVRVSVAVWSYVDDLAFGITADRDTTPDLDRLVAGVERAFAALLDAAAVAATRPRA